MAVQVNIYKGSFHINNLTAAHIGEQKKTATKVYVNLAEPDYAEKDSKKEMLMCRFVTR